jgi:hypothetical protein
MASKSFAGFADLAILESNAEPPPLVPPRDRGVITELDLRILKVRIVDLVLTCHAQLLYTHSFPEDTLSSRGY